MNSGNNSDAFGTNPEENLAKIRQKLQEAHERCERYKAKMAQIKRSYFKLQSEQQRVSNKAFKQQQQQQNLNLNLPQDVPAEGQSGLKKKQGDSNKEIIKHYVCNARGESCYNVNISDELRYKYVVKDKESVKETKPEVVYSPENYQRVESRQQQQQQQQQPQMQYQWQPTGGPYYKNKRIQKRPEKSKQKQGQQIQEHGQQMQGQQIKEKQIQGQQIQEQQMQGQQIQGSQQQAHQMQGQKHRQKQPNVNAHKTREMVIKGEAYCEMKNKSLEITCTTDELNMQNANSSNIVKVINGLIKNIAGKTINVKGGTDTKVQNVRQKNINVNKFKSVNKQASKVTIKNNKIRKTDEEEVVKMDNQNQNQKEQIIYNKRLNDRYNYYKERMHQNTNEAAYVEEQQEQEQMYESDQYENDGAYKNYYVAQTKYTNENNEEIYTQPYENNIQNRKNEDLNNYNQQQLQQAKKEQWAKIIHQQNMLNDYIHQQNLQNNTYEENASNNIYQENAQNNIYQENAQNNIYQENAQNNIYQENAQNKNNTYRENAHNENIYRENAQNKNIYRDNVQNKNIYRENAQKNNIYRENAHNNNIYQENLQNNDIYSDEYAEENYESLNEDNYKQQEEDTFKEHGKGMLNNLKGLYYNNKYKQHQDNINNDDEASYYNNYYQPAAGNLPDNLAQNVLNKADVLNYVYTENNYQNQAAYTPNVCYKNNKNKEINSNAKERVCDMEFNAVNATIENTKRAVTKTINDAIKCNATVNAINIDRYVGKIVNNKGHVARYVNKCGAGEKNEVKRKVQSPTMPKSILVNGKRRAKVNLTPKPKQASNNNKKHYPNKGTGQEELEKVLTSLCDSKMIEKLYDDIGDPEIVSGILEQLINITQDEIKKLEIKLSNDRRIKNCLAAKSDRRSANGKNVECACFHSDIATSEEAGFELEPEENVTELYLNALMQDETPSESYLNYINNLTN